MPLFVTATAGTTVLGAFDPFHDIADICKKHGLWMHVDVIMAEFFCNSSIFQPLGIILDYVMSLLLMLLLLYPALFYR